MEVFYLIEIDDKILKSDYDVYICCIIKECCFYL